MENKRQKLADLEKSGLSIRVEKEGRIVFASADPMLKPLLSCLSEHAVEMNGAIVIDKIVGRAAAYLCIVGRVAEVITPLASEPACTALQQAGIPLYAEKVIPQIMNRTNTGPCPMELKASGFTNANEFYQALILS
jgi:hypothetical protein